MTAACKHLQEVKVTQSDKDYCEDCVKIGASGCTCACA